MSRTRAWRRYQRQRIWNQRRRRNHWAFNADAALLARWHWGEGITSHELAARYIDTPCVCSCPMCGNPRRHFGTLPAQWEREVLRAGDIETELLELEPYDGPPDHDELGYLASDESWVDAYL